MTLETTSLQTPNTTAPEAPPADTIAQVESSEPQAKADPLDYSRRMNQLAQQDKYIREQRRILKKEQEAFQKQMAELENYKPDKIRERFKQSPLEMLQNDLGMTYDELTQVALGMPKKEDDPVKILQKELAELKNSLQKKDEENMNQMATTAERQIEYELSKHLEGTKDKYEFMSKLGGPALEIAKNLVIEYFQTHKSKPDPEFICQQVENYLEEQYKPILESAKAKLLMGLASQNQAAPQQATETAGTETAPRTLSNEMAPKTAAIAQSQQPLSRGELEKAAAGLLRWTK